MSTPAKAARHTPGPWRVVEDEHNEPWRKDVCHFTDTGECVTIANVRVAPPIGETEANANLLAAAPELLESTRELIALLDEQLGPAINPTILKALRAIAKAEGR